MEAARSYCLFPWMILMLVVSHPRLISAQQEDDGVLPSEESEDYWTASPSLAASTSIVTVRPLQAGDSEPYPASNRQEGLQTSPRKREPSIKATRQEPTTETESHPSPESSLEVTRQEPTTEAESHPSPRSSLEVTRQELTIEAEPHPDPRFSTTEPDMGPNDWRETMPSFATSHDHPGVAPSTAMPEAEEGLLTAVGHERVQEGSERVVAPTIAHKPNARIPSFGDGMELTGPTTTQAPSLMETRLEAEHFQDREGLESSWSVTAPLPGETYSNLGGIAIYEMQLNLWKLSKSLAEGPVDDSLALISREMIARSFVLLEWCHDLPEARADARGLSFAIQDLHRALRLRQTEDVRVLVQDLNTRLQQLREVGWDR